MEGCSMEVYSKDYPASRCVILTGLSIEIRRQGVRVMAIMVDANLPGMDESRPNDLHLDILEAMMAAAVN